MAQEEPVTGREKAVPCQHCYHRVYRPAGAVDWWIADDGTESRVCDPITLDLKHTPMPAIS